MSVDSSYIDAVAREYFLLKANAHTPRGFSNSSGLWVPDSSEIRDCCRHITQPTPRFPYTLLNHCKTITHLAKRYNVDKEKLKQKIREIQLADRNNSAWFDFKYCSKCHSLLQEDVSFDRQHRTPDLNFRGLSDNTKQALLLHFVVNDMQRYRVARRYKCHNCNIVFLSVCTNERYYFNVNKDKWIKLRGYKITQPQPTELVILCPLCSTELIKLKQYINNINGIYKTYEEILKSNRMLCAKCKDALNQDGFIYRYFEDSFILRFNFNLQKWVSVDHRYRQINMNKEYRRYDENLVYNDNQDVITRIAMHIKTKAEQQLNDDDIVKTIIPFKDIINEEEENVIANEILNIRREKC